MKIPQQPLSRSYADAAGVQVADPPTDFSPENAPASRLPPGLEIGLLTGGGDKPYAFGLATALTAKGVGIDFIGSDEIDSPELRSNGRLRFLNLRGSQRHDVSFAIKTGRILRYYARLIQYAAVARPRIFHILWNNRFQFFDRTLLMLFYKACGKKLAFTVHNVNVGKRDANDSWANRLTLKIQYRLADHLFVHTEAMRRELREDFGIDDESITVVPLGFNNSVPDTELTSASARQRLSIDPADRTILFFGHIGPYKGLDVLVQAFQQVAATDRRYRLLIVGKPKMGCEPYLAEIQRSIADDPSRDRVTQRIEFVPDEDTELYFKAADVLALPYTDVFQSGVLILGYTFGLPVVATDVGSLREDVLDGCTGLICRPKDPLALARAFQRYFDSDLYKTLGAKREEIRRWARGRYSWDAVADTTCAMYRRLIQH